MNGSVVAFVCVHGRWWWCVCVCVCVIAYVVTTTMLFNLCQGFYDRCVSECVCVCVCVCGWVGGLSALSNTWHFSLRCLSSSARLGRDVFDCLVLGSILRICLTHTYLCAQRQVAAYFEEHAKAHYVAATGVSRRQQVWACILWLGVRLCY